MQPNQTFNPVHAWANEQVCITQRLCTLTWPVPSGAQRGVLISIRHHPGILKNSTLSTDFRARPFYFHQVLWAGYLYKDRNHGEVDFVRDLGPAWPASTFSGTTHTSGWVCFRCKVTRLKECGLIAVGLQARQPFPRSEPELEAREPVKGASLMSYEPDIESRAPRKGASLMSYDPDVQERDAVKGESLMSYEPTIQSWRAVGALMENPCCVDTQYSSADV